MSVVVKWYTALPMQKDWSAPQGKHMIPVYSNLGVCADFSPERARCNQVVEVSPAGLCDIEVISGDYNCCGLLGHAENVIVKDRVTKDQLADALEDFYASNWCQTLCMPASVKRAIEYYGLENVKRDSVSCAGWKALHPDMTAYEGFRYELGEKYEMDGIVALCNRGFHFCRWRLVDVFNYYPVAGSTRIFTVMAWGRVMDDRRHNKSVATGMQLDRELSYDEIMDNLKKTTGRNRDDTANIEHIVNELQKAHEELEFINKHEGEVV